MAGRMAGRWMHRHVGRARWAAIAAVVVLGTTAPAVPARSAQGPAVLPVSAITVGMTGTGRTVLVGTRLSEFQVRVLGILRNAGPAGDLVLFRASGPALQSAGGLAAGMSGSPIYLGGRLAGAFSYSFQASDPFIGLFTPIEYMLRDLPRTAAVPSTRTVAIAPLRVGGQVIRHITVAASRRAVVRTAPGTLVAVPAATPLFLSGLDDAARASLAQVLEPMGVEPMAGGSSAALPPSMPLEPGSAIGVALLRGDIGAYAIGTLTYRDGNRLVAFGHPFMNLGPATYALTNATILQTVRGLSQNIKVGAAGAVVGVITEDRPAAVGGTIGVLPRLFGVVVRVTDDDSGVSRRFVYQVLPDKTLAPALVTLGAREAIERALNRSGAGTAEVTMTVRGRGLPDAITRDNRFYSASDIAGQALSEVPAALRLAFSNDFTDVLPTDMEMDIHVTSRQETALITAADVATRVVAPGELLHVRVTVRPFRGEPETRDVTVTVPADLPPGPALLVVRAGTTTVLPNGGTVPAAGPTPPVAGSLTEAIRLFEQQERHTDIVAEILTTAVPPGAQTGPGAGRISSTLTTPWVLDGRIPILLRIGGVAH